MSDGVASFEHPDITQVGATAAVYLGQGHLADLVKDACPSYLLGVCCEILISDNVISHVDPSFTVSVDFLSI